MTARLPLKLLQIAAISLPLTWIWIEWGRAAYGWLFLRLALPVFGLLGETSLMPVGARDRFINYLPFLILMLVTPRMSWLRRIVGIAVGFVSIFVSHLVFVWISHKVGVGRDGMTPGQFRTMFPVLMVSDALPLALWALFASQWIRETLARVIPASSPPSPDPPPR